MTRRFIVDLIDSDETDRFVGKYGADEITNMTNGDVIKALFPKYAKFQTDVQGVFLSDNDQTHICYTKDWWNAPYRKER